MRPRDATIPFFLWIACAILFHLSGQRSVEQVMTAAEEKRALRNFAAAVQRETRLETRPVEIALLEQKTPEPPAPTVEPAPTTPPKKKPEPPRPKPKPQPELKKLEPPKPVEKVEPAKPVELPKPAEKLAEQKPPDKKSEQEKKPPPQLTLPPKRAIAVRQHVKDENQPDNKDAEFLSEKNNKVEEQSQARITSTDQDSEKPEPGKKHQSADKEPGNADESRVASSEGTEDEGSPLPPEPQKPSQTARPENKSQVTPQAPAPASQPKEVRAQTPAPSPNPAEEKPTSLPAPNIVSGDQGEPFFSPAPNTSPSVTKKRLPPPPQKNKYSYGMGLGSGQTTPGGINLNLSFNQAEAVIGKEQLVKDRKADSLRLRSKHRGSWEMAGLNKWKSAIENYVPHVKLGNQTALNTRGSPFANYLNSMHQRIHVIFADSFLPALDQFPKGHPLSNYEMHTDLEIILNQNDGGVVTLGIVRTSGATAFDVNALEAVNKAAPFGKPPSEIVSPDGNVYLHWEFHRNPDLACSTWFAFPYILPGPAQVPPPAEPKTTPTRKLERHAPNEFVPTRFVVPSRKPAVVTAQID